MTKQNRCRRAHRCPEKIRKRYGDVFEAFARCFTLYFVVRSLNVNFEHFSMNALSLKTRSIIAFSKARTIFHPSMASNANWSRNPDRRACVY